MKKLKLTSLQNSSVLNKFNVFFILIAIIPISVMMYVYTQIDDAGRLQISKDDIQMAFIFVVLGVFGGYGALRAIMKGLIDVTQANTQALAHYVGRQQMTEIKEASSDEIAVLTRTFNEITTRLEENVKNLQLAQKTLHSVLSRVGKGIGTYDNIDEFLTLIVETVADALLAKKGFLLMYNPDTDGFRLRAVVGMKWNDIEKKSYKSNEVVFGQVLATKTSFIMQGLDIDESQLSQEVFEFPMICSPLIIKESVVGVMVVCGRKIDGGFFKDEMSLLFNVAQQTAVAIENDRLSSDAEQTYFDTISALAMAVEARDPYCRGHSERVAQYCVKIAAKLNMGQKDVEVLRDAAKVHDLGKIGVTDEILDKPGLLTEQEWLIMKKHPEIGEGIIKPIKSLSPLCDIVRHHHEKLDGSGYPDGLKSDEIKLPVRILTVADIYDALTTNRSYRKAMSSEQALKTLREMKDQVDQGIVDKLETVLDDQ